MDLPAIIIDNGTGYTKMGYSGNMDPSFMIPTVISDRPAKVILESLTDIRAIMEFRS